MPKRILVLGGAGYIGSHMVLALQEAGHEVIVLDNLSNGHADAVPAGVLHVGDVGDARLLESLLANNKFDGVIHFAAFIEAGESVKNPEKFFHNNTAKSLNVLDAIARHGLPLIFSSTAALYGNPVTLPIPEDHAFAPVSPYGASKLMVEEALRSYHLAKGLRYMALRYFNAAGADPKGRLGERHNPETHLVPLILQVASGRRPQISIYGTDYPTPDGTCIRDYVHVCDLVEAHLLALEHLWSGGKSVAVNLGGGEGISVRDMITTAAKVTKRPIPAMETERRPGDPAILTADITRARTLLNWTPKQSDPETLVRHAWAWEQKMAKGMR